MMAVGNSNRSLKSVRSGRFEPVAKTQRSIDAGTHPTRQYRISVWSIQ
ncbi:hypothetical protein CKA32_001549 [Geitlerinema sp. FC II]|nr:hypothetical protein CKA32_001549 [Geitlerinema sp. FC II]